MHTARHGLAALVLAALASTAGARDNASAEAAFTRNDHAALLKELLPAYNRGELRDGRALYLLSRACYFQQHSLRSMFDRSALCNNRTGAITKAAADAGSVDAMLDLAYTLDSPMRELRHPDLPQNRMQAYRYALAAAELAATPEQQERAIKAVATVEARIPASQRMSAGATTVSAQTEHEDDEFGADEDYNPHIENPVVMDCGSTPLRRGSDITVKLDPALAAREFGGEQFGELSIWPQSPQGTESTTFLLVQYEDPPQRLLRSGELQRARQLTIPSTLQAISWQDMKQAQPVFTRAGSYTLFWTPALESGVGGYVCKIEYRP